VFLLLLVASAGWTQTSGVPGAGTFLVASRELLDPNFRESVVLILEYGEDGAVGLVVNRPSTVPLSTLVPYIQELRERPDTLYLGGPVEPLRMTFLFRSPRSEKDALRVFGDVWASSSFELLEDTVQEAGSPIRVYAGYAGWAPLQLDGEIGRGDWHLLDPEPEVLFSPAPGEVWRELIQKVELRVVGL
jgi:putative transcriptional regulator